MSSNASLDQKTYDVIACHFDMHGENFEQWSADALSLYHQHKNHPDILPLQDAVKIIDHILTQDHTPKLQDHVKLTAIHAFHQENNPEVKPDIWGKLFGSLRNWQFPAAAGAGVVAASLGVFMAVSVEPVLTPEEELSYYLTEIDDYTEFEVDAEDRDAS